MSSAPSERAQDHHGERLAGASADLPHSVERCGGTSRGWASSASWLPKCTASGHSSELPTVRAAYLSLSADPRSPSPPLRNRASGPRAARWPPHPRPSARPENPRRHARPATRLPAERKPRATASASRAEPVSVVMALRAASATGSSYASSARARSPPALRAAARHG